MRLDWSDALWEEKAIRIREEIAKSTGRKAGDERFVPMSAQLSAWLSPWHGRAEGKVCTRGRFESSLEHFPGGLRRTVPRPHGERAGCCRSLG